MAVTHLELNLVRLLSRCKALAAERCHPGEWGLGLGPGAVHPAAPELMNEYFCKVNFLKGHLEAEKWSSSTEKALANQFLTPGQTTTAKEQTPATKTVHLSELLGTVCSGASSRESPTSPRCCPQHMLSSLEMTVSSGDHCW
uniref:Uncharacterized protein n=1 Tax=Crocodylus porosus TaxID=8502 RepID=A0A7M4FID2_CROPO